MCKTHSVAGGGAHIAHLGGRGVVGVGLARIENGVASCQT
jgi:hypothetical protein